MTAIMYRLRSTLRAQLGSVVGVAAVIAIVGAIVLSIAAGAHRTATVADRYTASVGGAPDALITQLQEGRPQTAVVANLPSVEHVDALTFMFADIRPKNATGPLAEGDGALVFAGTFQPTGERVVEGRAPADPLEFVAERGFVRGTGLQLGDEVDVVTYTQASAASGGFGVEPPDGPTLTGRLVGVLDGPSSDNDQQQVAVFPVSFLDIPDIGVSQTLMWATLRDGRDLTDLRTELDDIGGQAFNVERGAVIDATLRRAIDAQATGLWLVAGIGGIAALAVLGQFVTRYLRRTAADRVALSAIGETDAQILVESIGRAAVPIGAGSLVGAALAIAPSPVFPIGFSRRVEPHPGVRIDGPVLALGALALIVGLLAWSVVALAIERRAVRAAQPSRLVDRIAVVTTPSAATGLRFAFTRPSSERAATAPSIAGVAMVVAALVGATVFGVSLRRLLTEPFRYGSNFDLQIGDNGGSELDPLLIEHLRDDPNVTSLVEYATDSARSGDMTVELLGMQQVRGGSGPRIVSGRLPASEDETALGSLTANDLGVSVGDELLLDGPTASRPLHVTGIAIVTGLGPNDGMGEGAVVTFAGLQRLDADASLAAVAVQVRDVERARHEYQQLLGFVPDGPFAPAAVVNVARIRSVPFVLAGLLALLAALSVVHVMLTSLRRRRRDFAVLTALGADRGWLRRTIHWQGTLFMVVPVAIGIPLGIAVGRVVFAAFADSMGALNEPATPALWLLVVGAGAILLANLATLAPSWRARSARPAAVLRTQ
jgi:ABC-type lipoprotein release transport system permease subunit